MELRQLRYFVAVAEELHFARAAARLLIAGPSLSQQIKALERTLSVTLFDRSSTGVSLTPAGERLLPLARAALGAAEEILDTAHRISQERATVLRLGFLAFSLTAASRWLLTEFGRKVPSVTVQMRQYEWDDPSAGLLSGDTDAALVRPPFTGADGLEMLDLASDPLLAIVAEGHELAALETVSSEHLAREPWLEADAVTDPVFALLVLPRPSGARVRGPHHRRDLGGMARRNRLRPRRQHGPVEPRRAVPPTRPRLHPRLGRTTLATGPRLATQRPSRGRHDLGDLHGPEPATCAPVNPWVNALPTAGDALRRPRLSLNPRGIGHSHP